MIVFGNTISKGNGTIKIDLNCIALLMVNQESKKYDCVLLTYFIYLHWKTNSSLIQTEWY